MTPKEAEEMESLQNTKKKKKKRAKEEEKRKKAPKQRKKKALPMALLISAQGSATYADILKEVKKGLAEEELEENVDKVRRTNNDHLLIVLNRQNGDKLEPLQRKVAKVLGGQAVVSGKSHEVELSIRDIEETTTKEEVGAALQKAAGDEVTVTKDAIRALRSAYNGTKIASIKLPEEVARKVIGDRGKIRIGLVNCPVKEVPRPHASSAGTRGTLPANVRVKSTDPASASSADRQGTKSPTARKNRTVPYVLKGAKTTTT